MEIGKKIRNLRLACGLTQEELGDRCDLTKGYISQLENDLTSPAIVTLNDILNALGTTLKNFFDNENVQIVFNEDDYFEKQDDGYKMTWLVPSSQKNMLEPVILEIEPDAMTTMDNPHNGEEFGYVLQGSITLVVDKKEYSVKKGESFYYEADVKHYIKNTGKIKAKVVWVSTPPNF